MDILATSTAWRGAKSRTAGACAPPARPGERGEAPLTWPVGARLRVRRRPWAADPWPFTAVRMTSATAPGCESAIECEASTSIVSAPARSAINRSASGGIALSAVATMAHEGSDFPTAASARSSKIAANGRWLTARTSMASVGRSAANASW